MIFFVRLEMLGQVRDALAEYCDLNFRGPRIGRMDAILDDKVYFVFLRQTHWLLFSLFLYDANYIGH